MKDGAELTAELDRVKAASSRLQHVRRSDVAAYLEARTFAKTEVPA
jgi:hypothetical protein